MFHRFRGTEQLSENNGVWYPESYRAYNVTRYSVLFVILFINLVLYIVNTYISYFL